MLPNLKDHQQKNLNNDEYRWISSLIQSRLNDLHLSDADFYLAAEVIWLFRERWNNFKN